MPETELSARQREILATAGRLLEERGLEGLTMGAVARELGVKTPSLYKHFADKGELEAMLIAEGLERQAAALEAAEGLEGIARAYREWALAEPERYRLMTERPLPRGRLPEGLEARAAAPLLAAVGDPDLARAAWAFAHGMVQLELAGRFPPGADLDAAWARALAAFGVATAGTKAPAG